MCEQVTNWFNFPFALYANGDHRWVTRGKPTSWTANGHQQRVGKLLA